MNTTSFIEPSIDEENAGAVRLHLKGILTFNISLTNLTVANVKMPGNTVNIRCGDIEGGPGKTITTIAGTVIAKHPILGVLFIFFHI